MGGVACIGVILMPAPLNVDDLSSLDPSQPTNDEMQRTAAPYRRSTKDVIKKTFAHIASNGGVVAVTAGELSNAMGLTEPVQVQIDSFEAPWGYTELGAVTLSAGDKLKMSIPAGGVTVTLPTAPLAGVMVELMDIQGPSADPAARATVVAGGSDTIFDVDAQVDGLSQITLPDLSQYQLFVYVNEAPRMQTWVTWKL